MSLPRARQYAALLAMVGSTLCAVAWFLSPVEFFRAYLAAFLFVLGVPLGSLGLLLLHTLTRGDWGGNARGFYALTARTLPLVALLFVPVLIGTTSLYGWSNESAVAQDHVLQHKRAFLNLPFFAARAVLYFGVWIYFAIAAGRRKERSFSAAGLIVYAFTMTFAAIDWAMSLNPHWFSTTFGFLFLTGQALSALAFSTLVLYLLGVARGSKQLHDLGNLLLTFTMLWTYIAFTQFLIIWAGNLQEEIPWYIQRLFSDWAWIAVALVLFQFLLPFLLLLFRAIKQNARLLVPVCGLILLMRLIDNFWVVLPSARGAAYLHWVDVAAPLAVGGIWMTVFLTLLMRERKAEVQANG